MGSASKGMQDLNDRQLLSVVIPIHDEEDVLPLVHERVSATARALADFGLEYEIVFVDDGSRDDSPRILDDLAGMHSSVRVVHLARNFGHQAAVSAGLTQARGDVVAIMDADLQDPPEVLPELLERWRLGNQVVYAIRDKRKEGKFKRLTYSAFYRIYRAISEVEMPLDSGDFCVLDRTAVDLLNSLPERQRFVRGLRSWIGLRQVGVHYERAARHAGRSSYTFRALLKLATDGLIGFSAVPLRLVTSIGLLSMVVAIALGVWIVAATIYEASFGGDTPRGWASLACLIVFFSSVQLLSVGIIGEYMARVFLEVKGRPTFLIGRVVEHKADRTVQSRASDSQPQPSK